MNETQWVFESETLIASEKRRYEEMSYTFKLFRTLMVNILGLNVMPIKDTDTGFLRMPEEGEIVPLSMAAGSEGWLTILGKKMEEYVEQEEKRNKMGDDVDTHEDMSYEELMEFLGEDEQDIEFDNDEDYENFLKSNSKHSRLQHDKMVSTFEGDFSDTLNINKHGYKDTEFKNVESKGTKLMIATDDSLSEIKEEEDKLSIIIETTDGS